MANTSSDLDGIFSRATVDATFRQNLVANAIPTLKAAGYDTSDFSHVQFIERPAHVDAVLVLPDFRAAESLSVEELEAVAGGVDCPLLSDCKCTASVACTKTCGTTIGLDDGGDAY